MVTSGTDDKSRTSESNLPGERTSARKLRVPSAICKRASPSGAPFFHSPFPSLSLSLFLHLFYLELYMPQFRICVKQCAKLYGVYRIVARWIVSRSDKPDKNSNLWIFKVRLNRVNFSRNIGKWFIGPPLYFTDSSNYEHQSIWLNWGETIFHRFI